MFRHGLIYFFILFLEAGINYLTMYYFIIDFYLGIFAFIMHIFLGMYGVSLFCNKYRSDIINQSDGFLKSIEKQQVNYKNNEPQIYLDCSGKTQQKNPSFSFIKAALSNLTSKESQFLVLNNATGFIKAILSKENNVEKLFYLEYLDANKNLLFESQNLQSFDQSLVLFKLFLFEEESLSDNIS